MKGLARLRKVIQRRPQIAPLVNKLSGRRPRFLDIGKQLRDAVRPVVVSSIGMKYYPGKQVFNPDLPTLIVVSHEASATGAPILAWNLCEHLGRSNNVVVLLLRPGPLIPDFQEYSIGVLRARQQLVITEQLQRELRKLLGSTKPEVAFVNSIVSHPFIKPLRSLGIATVSLIHEFPSSLRPSHLLTEISSWSTSLVFSSDLTRDDLCTKAPHLHSVRTEVFAQGPCKRPNRPGRVAAALPQFAGLDAQEFLADLRETTFFVLAAGEVNTRKGVDLFIAVCALIKKRCPDADLRFAWIGAGYNPFYDTETSLWLEDQIFRSGLQKDLKMLEHSSGYKDLLERSNLFIVSSRLDPLPNVAVDALLAAKPVLCFANACGIANILLQDDELGNSWVSPYLDVDIMANQAIRMLQDPEQRRALSGRSQKLAKQWFNMPSYVEHLSVTAQQAAADVLIEQTTISRLVEAEILDPSFITPEPSADPSLAAMEYVLSWRQEVWPRKPFAGFHPGIYRQRCLQGQPTVEPALHFQQSGRPTGEWKSSLLLAGETDEVPLQPSKIAIHLHLTKHWIMPLLLDSICLNKTPADIFITSSEPSIEDWIQEEHRKRGLTIREHHIVPRRGRDIAALFLGVLSRIENEYEIYGHVHTDTHLGLSSSRPDTYQQFLLAHLLGSGKNRQLDTIVQAFHQDRELGLVYPCDPVCFHWKRHLAPAKALGEMLNLNTSTMPGWMDFPVASMFWARRGAFRRLAQLNLKWLDFPSDIFEPEASFLTAFQGLLPAVVTDSGYLVQQTHVPGICR